MLCDYLPIANDGQPVDAQNWPQDVVTGADGSLTITSTNPSSGRRYQQTVSVDAAGEPVDVSQWKAL